MHSIAVNRIFIGFCLMTGFLNVDLYADIIQSSRRTSSAGFKAAHINFCINSEVNAKMFNYNTFKSREFIGFWNFSKSINKYF